MAHLDSETGNLNLQVVYDGAPGSGKTSSVVALGRLLDCPVVTPSENNGRTLYFDWMDYVGGLCRGRPIQCRVISVPGQDELAKRRQMILRAADAVIFVIDTSASRFGSTKERFEDLRSLLAQRRREIPILLQLNKRDTHDALPASDVISTLGAPTIPQIETVATDGHGVREAFVLAVGASLKILRSSDGLYESGVFDTQEMQLPDPDQLLELLEAV